MPERRRIQLSFLWLVAYVLLTQAAAVVAQTATQTPSARDAVVEKIEARARSDVKDGLTRQTQFAVELFRDNEAGLTAMQVAEIYDAGYQREKERDPFRNIRPDLGWIVAAVIALITIVGTVLQKSIAELVKAAGKEVYKRFSGTILLRPWALSCYRAALKAKYVNISLPFRPNRPLSMREVYVPLRVSGSADEGLTEAGSLLPRNGNGSGLAGYGDEVEARQALSRYKRLMVKGLPGAGKSMLMKYIVFKYAEGGFVELPDRPVPILLELHRLNDPTTTLEKQLVEELKRNDFDHGESFAARNLKNGRLMLLLDGLDEVSGGERARVVQHVKDFMGQYGKCRVVITCRTAVYRNDFGENVEQTMDIVDFNDSQIRQFLRSWELDSIPDKSVEQLMQTLLQRPLILKMARNPLLLTIIAYLYADTDVKLPQSRAEFYRKATDILLDVWHEKYNTFPARKKRRVLEQLALANQDSARERPHDPMSMDYETVKRQALLALKEDLKPEEAESLIAEIEKRSGLLLSIDGGARYQFAHLTLQEYFAATKLKDDGAGLVGRFRADPERWRETVKLWCGLEHGQTEPITRLIWEINDLDPITAFECIADAQDVDMRQVGGIIDGYKQKLNHPDREDPVVRAFGAVASDTRPRGAQVFAFLAETVRDDADVERRKAAATALALTNLPSAAAILAEQYGKLSEIPTLLVSMGDLAVPELAGRAEDGDENALDCLRLIGTPLAAHMLAGMLWNDTKTDVQRAAAWRLASLLRHKHIEEALSAYALTPLQRAAARLDYVWEPFAEDANSPLSIIAGRVAYLLADSDNHWQPHPTTIPDIDPRLGIPLCAVNAWSETKKEVLHVQATADMIDAIGGVVELLNRGEVTSTIEPGSDVKVMRIPAVWRELALGRSTKWGLSDFKETLEFFDQHDGGDAFREAQQLFMNKAVEAVGAPPLFSHLLPKLPQDTQRELLRRLGNEPLPTRADWRNVFKPLVYTFDKGWHYRGVILLVLLFSAVALTQMFFVAFAPAADDSWGAWLKVWFARVGIVGTVWALVVFFRGGGETFDDLSPYQPGFLLALFIYPAVALILPFFLLFDKNARKDIKDMVLICTFTVFAPALLFFTSTAFLRYMAWPYVALIWGAAVGVAVVLVIAGKQREREAKNPLYGIMEAPDTVGTRKRQPPAFRLWRNR
jgi:hypothetical protein